MVVKSSRDLTDVQDYLNQVKNRPHIRNVPSLNKDLLIRARNGIRHSVDNNDLLEFIGDRALNLIGALLVERDKLSKAHHTAVRQVVCNNDTFGRLGFYLKLHAHAHLSAQDNKIIDSWNPLCPEAPPKVLADLFEAYAGAVYIQHGWQRLSSWLSALLEPIVRRATGDYWLSARPEQIFGIPAHPAHTLPCPETRSQGTLLDYVVFKRNWLAEQGTNAVRALPRGTRFRFEKKGWLCAPDCERLEVAVHLINMWICRIVIGLWPEYHQATSKAAHILSAITGLVTSERVMAYLGSSLSLADYLREASGSESSDDDERPAVMRCLSPTFARLAVAFKATVGWFYDFEPDRADSWGERFFRPIVIRAHDIMVQEHGYRPLIPASHKRDIPARAGRRSPEPVLPEAEDPLVGLIARMGSVKLAEAAAQQADDHATPGGTPSHSSPPAPIAPQSRLDRTKWRPLGRPNSSTKIADSSDDKESGDADDLTRLTRELTSLSLNTEGRLQGPSDANAGPVRSDHATRDVSLQPDTPLLTCADSTGACASTRAKSRPLSPDVAEKEDAAVHGLPPNALSEDTSPTAPPSAMSILAKTSRNTPTTSLLAVRSAADHSPTNGSRDACVPAQSRATDDNAVPSPALILAFTSGTPHSRTQSSTMFVPRALHAKARAGSSRTPS